jgi:PAS domain S-box-containing protein
LEDLKVGLRVKLLFPILLAGLLLATYAVAHQQVSQITSAILLGLLALLLLVTGISVQAFLLGPLRRLRQAASDLARMPNSPPAPPAADFGELQDLAANLSQLHKLIAEYERKLAQESGQRQELEQTLREAQERHMLAVRCANDGVMEWDLKTDRVYFSPLWKSILGYGEHAIGDSIDEWRERIHPADRDHVSAGLQAHMDGRTPRLENEHRLRHRDGTWRWVLIRGTAIRHASGKPYRLVTLHTDITARKQVQEAVVELADRLADLRGDNCLQLLVRNLAQTLGVREAFICECCNYPTTRVRMLARWNSGGTEQLVEFDLPGTACEHTIVEGKVYYCPKALGERFPIERQFERESYLGIPIMDAGGKVIGHIACADSQPMREDLPHQAIFKLFAVRASVELERRSLARGRELGMSAA